MPALLDAAPEQLNALGAVTDMLVSVERTIASLLAAHDGLLALGNRIALETAEEARTDESSPYLGHDGADLAVRAVAAEFGAALRMSDRTVQRRMADADLLVTLFPAVWRAQGAGDISPAHARVIVDVGMSLEGEAERDAYTAEILEHAAVESPNRLRRRARRIAERHQRRTIDERHRAARADRAVWVKDLDDGMAELGLRGPSALVHGAFDRLSSMAKAARDQISVSGEHAAVPTSATAAPEERIPDTEVAPDTRTLAQARSDLALDLLLTGAPFGHDDDDGRLAAIRGSVSITVPVLTLMGSTTTPAEIDGHAPIDADTARQLAGSAPGWDRVLTHPVTDAVLAVDRYRPSPDLKRLVRARDQRCRFPCCGLPARDCDLDHTRDHALGGDTSTDNLAALCRRHHVLKHHSPWHVENLGGGFHSWMSPTGRVYVDAPPEANAAPIPRDAAPPF
ncbi:hypothetical protein AUC47_01315 [Microbacterium sp. SZ1]|uniref:HNH endonuclease signature motif containing protein n=1 Tax=Microbacterium sp. SZ1 TaxID=1849736 RepID=UPI000BBCD100|nr:HNH endonuclease signature motif containing protein [Microbacterium sp. SZ1]PCE14817.1 hypothetical protein AUC47_01315 [Microbacterium sp. SZ1]